MITAYGSSKDVLTAEIYWVLDTVAKHRSFRSSEKSGDLFRCMFPDSAIASKFGCGEKCKYIATFGLAPYFKAQLLAKVKSSKEYVVLFDESLNPVMQMKQMDVMVRLWDLNKVVTRFHTSKFLGHAYSETL